MNNFIYIPSNGPDSWKELLAKPEKQWKTGFSAKTLAHSWEDNNGFPDEFKGPLESAKLNLEVLFAIPEFKVDLDNKKAPSQSDLFVLSSDPYGLVTMVIEGKVNEQFDKTIKDWNNSQGKINRFEFLSKKLEINYKISDLNDLRYQLFHRTASSILIAEKFMAKKAIMIIHSFNQKDKHFNDFSDFVKKINPSLNPTINKVNYCKKLNSGIDLYIGWIKGDKKYLEKV